MEEFIIPIQQSVDALIRPVLLFMLLGVGVFLTFRLKFIQFRRFGHGLAVASGRYDNPDDPGDVSHFQALTTALSATVGIGNIAGVAIAIHFGGPGAIFWMWVTAVLGMAVKYTEVTLAQRYRIVEGNGTAGTVSGGPMYYIEQGLGPRWKPLAVFVAFGLMLTAFLSGNAIQANTISDLMAKEFGTPVWVSGGFTAAVVGIVILGGIRRIGRATSIIAPFMATVYVIGGMLVLAINYESLWPSIQLIFREAFNPSAGVAGTGTGVFLQTLLWGVRRGLFSNEAGQGSAPIAHSAAKTDEPVSEGVVALLEPFIDTLCICTVTAMVILTTGVWKETTGTTMELSSGDATYVLPTATGYRNAAVDSVTIIGIREGRPVYGGPEAVRFAWHEVPVKFLYLDPEHSRPFNGVLYPGRRLAVGEDQVSYPILFGPAVENGAPLTRLAYRAALGQWGAYIVVLSVFLFGISTAISWSYYGDRCVVYLFGKEAIWIYKGVYVLMHFVGAIASLNIIWNLGDTVLSFVTIPNVFALFMLSGVVKKLTDRYFAEKPWDEG